MTAIDLATSNYAHDRLFPVQDYDGRRIPLADRSVDVIFSSNVLEHVDNFDEISAEFRRVLKPEGFAIHVLPTTAWRFWSFVSGTVKSLDAAASLPPGCSAGSPGEKTRTVSFGNCDASRAASCRARTEPPPKGSASFGASPKSPGVGSFADRASKSSRIDQSGCFTPALSFSAIGSASRKDESWPL